MKRPPIIVIQLVHIVGPLKGEIQEFIEPAISIGRHPSCQVRFPADLATVSRKHAEITREGNQFKVIDHSANGTFVNGKQVKESLLKDGDVLEFSKGGPKVSFLTQMKEESYVPPEPPPPPPVALLEFLEAPLPPPPPAPINRAFIAVTPFGTIHVEFEVNSITFHLFIGLTRANAI